MHTMLLRLVLTVCLPILFVPLSSSFGQSPPRRLNVGYLPIVAQLPLIVSHHKDRLRFKNIELSLFRYNSFTSLEAAIRVGAIDAALLPVPIVLSMAADEVEVKILGSLTLGGSLLFSRQAGDYSSLKGKVIGLPGLDSTENLLLKEALGERNFRYGLDYKTINIPFNSALDDLRSGRIDALYYPEPFATLAFSRGIASAVLYQDEHLAGNLLSVLVVKSHLLESGWRAALKEWLSSLVSACVFLQDHGQRAEPGPLPSLGFDQEIVNYSLQEEMGGIRFLPLPADIDRLDTYLEQVIQLKILYRSIALESLLAPHLFQEIISEADARE